MYNAGAASQAQMIYGQLAAVKGNSAQVRAYGQKIATAHEQAIADLRAIAANDHVELITGMDKIHQKRLALLLTLVGEPFDTAYVSAQLKNHQEAIAMYQFELDSGKYDALRDHASAYLNFTVAQRANAETLALDIAVTPSN